MICSKDGGSPLAAIFEQYTMNNVAYSDQLISHFLQGYTADATRRADVAGLPSFTWILRLPAMRGQSRVLDMAAWALSSAGLARENHDLSLLRNASAAYGKALAGLQLDLRHPFLSKQTETLFSCMALLLFQIVGDYPEKESWMSHVKGVAELVRLRGPSSYTKGHDHAVFRSCRVNVIIAGLCSQQSTFLATYAWRSIPWSLSPKSDYDTMVDRITFLPTLLARSDAIKKTANVQHTRDLRERLVWDCWRLEASFFKWYDDLAEDVKTYNSMDRTYHIPDHPSLESTFPSSYQFTTLSAAHLHMMYWASLIILWNLQRLTLQSLRGIETSYYWPPHPAALRCESCFAAFRSSFGETAECCQCGLAQSWPHHDISHLRALATVGDAVDAASWICMSMLFCLEQEFKVMGPYYTLFPIKIAIGTFTANLPSTKIQLRWCYKIIDELENRGLRFSRKMLGTFEGRTLGGFAG